MTEKTVKTAKKSRALALPRAKQTLFCFACAFYLCLLIKNAPLAAEKVSSALSLCAKNLVPSLFPFMVTADILSRCGIDRPAERMLGGAMRALFGVSGRCSAALLLGALCGFPTGARSALTLYDAGEISRRELQTVLPLVSIPSPAFMIGYVGVSLFSSQRTGVLLYLATLLSSLITGVMWNFLHPEKDAPDNTQGSKKVQKAFGLTDIPRAVSSSAMGVITVCAFVVFFNTLLGTLGEVFSTNALPASAVAALFCLLELTGGVSEAAALPPSVALPLTAFAASWSGLCVCFQIMSLCDSRPISFRPYILSKLASGTFCAITVYLFLPLL